MKLSKLRRKLRKQSRKADKLAHRMAIDEVLNSPLKLEMLNQRIEAEVNPWNSQGLVRRESWDWKTWLANAWDWFLANWEEILRIILTIAPLLLEPKRAKNR